MARPRALSGIQPTADSFHLGNYLGAVRQWVGMQETHDAFYFIADLHALTVHPSPAEVRRRTRVAAAQLFGAGIDPERSTLFVQSHVREHAELAWMLMCETGMGEAGRMTQYKDKVARLGESAAGVGLFAYPMMMAADILLYQTDQVPVGADQKQHLEITRDLAQRFNSRYGPTFTVPEPYIVKEVEKIADLQDPLAKMSKTSSGPQGLLEVLEEPGPLRKKIMRAVTDTGSEVVADPENKPGVTNLLRIQSVLTGTPVPELEARYAGQGYGTFKKDVAEVVTDTFAPIRERVVKLLADEAELDKLLAIGSARAAAIARETMASARENRGLLPKV
ncbi:tryptophan--tRNA ligase [Sphaerisporangium rufum]|uniref:Tryptophan--tRNA ligase n=1 Tax=Sphaerisporangium rufum TaxID=1381558 RepID=A0A919QWT6_9ACTN|nr:tryptophan--tRNA ligase [Sphaerisporangium rufum]GII75561.1 tryptophan--tRNA ligase [Sphaerisporangium rufum]